MPKLLCVSVSVALYLGCFRLPHVEPKLRTAVDSTRAAVDVYVSCSTPDLSSTMANPKPAFQWSRSRGAGLIVSEQHVLTVAHVVRCPDIPTVMVVLYDGRSFRMIVERDDGMFGDGNDLARLVIPSGSKFRRYIAPPKLGDSPGGHYRIALIRGSYEGERRDLRRFIREGDSGAGVYTPDGALVGVLMGTDSSGLIQFARVDSTWLEGT